MIRSLQPRSYKPCMVNNHWRGCFFASLLILLCSNVRADESDIIKADRQALAEANATGISSKIIAAKEQLSDDLGM